MFTLNLYIFEKWKNAKKNMVCSSCFSEVRVQRRMEKTSGTKIFRNILFFFFAPGFWKSFFAYAHTVGFCDIRTHNREMYYIYTRWIVIRPKKKTSWGQSFAVSPADSVLCTRIRPCTLWRIRTRTYVEGEAPPRVPRECIGDILT